MNDNIVQAQFNGRRNAVTTRSIYQWDYGMRLVFSGLDLPTAYTVHFANNAVGGSAVQMLGDADGVDIPNTLLKTGLPVYAFVYLHSGEDDGETVYTAMIPVIKRPEPTDEEPTPEQQSVIDQAIVALNEAVTDAETAVSHYPRINDGEWETWDVAEGEYVSTGVEAQGPQGEPGADGAPGRDGTDGTNGTDGVSPTVSVTSISGGHQVSITDAQGTDTFDVMDGVNGQNGSPGADGYSPSASVSKSGNTATITITDKTGTTTATVSDGQDGTNGTDGTDAYVYIRYSATEPTQDSDMKTTPDAWIGIYSGDAASAPTAYTAYTWYKIKGETGAAGQVQDVQVNGTSILDAQGVANVPIASGNALGAIKVSSGLYISSAGDLKTNKATDAQLKTGTNDYLPVVPSNHHAAAFYGLAKAAGDSTQASSDNAVGTYTDAAKIAIQKMLGIYEPPGDLLNDITLTEEGRIDLTADANGTPYDLLGVFIRVCFPANLTTASTGYARYVFDDINGQYLNTETGKYMTATYAQCKFVHVMRDGSLAMACYSPRAAIGTGQPWYIKDFSSNGYRFNFGNIVRIRMNAEDVEPAGTQIQIYGQRAY